MEIRDFIHGSIEVSSSELQVVDSRTFQRLRHIKQLGFGENSYPSATHNRYVHSLGALWTATLCFDTVFGGRLARTGQIAPDRLALHEFNPEAAARLRQCVRLAALLHDVGHGPLSHTTEFAMPKLGLLQLPEVFSTPINPDRKSTHEDYTLKMILDSPLTKILEKAFRPSGVKPIHIAALVDSNIRIEDGFFTETLDAGGSGQKIDFRPVLQQMISSEIDADRMDYLRRDSAQAGVSYGLFDFDWLVGNLTSHVFEGRCHLALQHRALFSFEDFLISRFHMFLMVYFHHKSVVYDEMLSQYFSDPECDYALPSDIEQYAQCDDAHLFLHLSKSKNIWARRITVKQPYRMLIELHSGVPSTKIAALEQAKLLDTVQSELRAQNIHWLLSTSTGELSKYFHRPGTPIFVRYDNLYSTPSYIPLEQCTDLFERFSEKRSITRMYVSPEDLPRLREQRKYAPFQYLEDDKP